MPFAVFVVAFVLVEFTRSHKFSVGGDVDFDGVGTSEVACFFYFFLGEGGVDKIGGCIVEVEGVHRSREELSKGSVFFHLCEDFVDFFVSLFFGVLFVEDAEGLILQTDTSKAEGAGI